MASIGLMDSRDSTHHLMEKSTKLQRRYFWILPLQFTALTGYFSYLLIVLLYKHLTLTTHRITDQLHFSLKYFKRLDLWRTWRKENEERRPVEPSLTQPLWCSWCRSIRRVDKLSNIQIEMESPGKRLEEKQNMKIIWNLVLHSVNLQRLHSSFCTEFL